ncbi:DUF6421 family protein [Tsukamurella sp. 8F]|uniref:DUF6421 family protein n=1 Tax=unclassified Tsukamurella TaxID=2633480 RepID=UPI0023B923E5|nr:MULTISPECIES: DUF6421 family protein [unclassified Tsukamurella]MDF0530007.1 DUF6421 family protein [Tsukamurella sp. 8J]MDF0587221.1 DUF6421 family protein [Tsukamurella sp. 8F]
MSSHDVHVIESVIGEPEVVEDSRAWQDIKEAATAIQAWQAPDGSVPDPAEHADARAQIRRMVRAVQVLTPSFPHDDDYLAALVDDLERWSAEAFGVPDFSASLAAFAPQHQRVDRLRHLVVFPMYTQNGSPDRRLEALIVEVIWPDFVARLEAAAYANPQFVSLRLIDFTAGYDSNSAVLFPETVSAAAAPPATWGAIFSDREAARYRRVVRAAAESTRLELPDAAARMLDDQGLTERTFAMWDIIHDRTHMRGDLPFDPFMIRQRMPYFLYALEELRCDLTAFREAAAVRRRLAALPVPDAVDLATVEHARMVQYAVVFDRIFRFAITGTRVRNYDALGGQLVFAWLHQHGVLHWTDTALRFDWSGVPGAMAALGEAIDGLYWRSIDRPKAAHWLDAYDLLRSVLTPHPASRWARGLPDEVLSGPPRGFTDAVLDDEFPLSMFYEALERRMRPVIASTAGIRGTAA